MAKHLLTAANAFGFQKPKHAQWQGANLVDIVTDEPQAPAK